MLQVLTVASSHCCYQAKDPLRKLQAQNYKLQSELRAAQGEAREAVARAADQQRTADVRVKGLTARNQRLHRELQEAIAQSSEDERKANARLHASLNELTANNQMLQVEAQEATALAAEQQRAAGMRLDQLKESNAELQSKVQEKELFIRLLRKSPIYSNKPRT
jgi:hypothetical protein